MSRTFRVPVGLTRTIALLAVVLFASGAVCDGADAAAEALVSQWRAAQQTTGVLLRLRLVVSDEKGETQSVMQLRVQSRRDLSGARWRYQALWPAARRGQALYLELPDNGPATGFRFEPPDKTVPLTAETLAAPFWDSDLSLEDLTEDFWRWPEPVRGEDEVIDGERCASLAFRAPAGRATAVSLVRVWLVAAKSLPVRIEKMDREGRLLKRLLFRKPVRRDGCWTPTLLVVQAAGRPGQTTIEISRGERDVEIAPEEFSLAAIQRFAQTMEAEAAAEAEAAKASHSVHK